MLLCEGVSPTRSRVFLFYVMFGESDLSLGKMLELLLGLISLELFIPSLP